jgi:YfiH family protein
MERRELADTLHALTVPDLEERGFLVAFTERAGGVSDGPYASLNLDDRRDDRHRVAENRRRVIDALYAPPFTLGEQIHGSVAARVGERRAGAGWNGAPPVPRADILEVTRPRLPVAILVADCLPIALAAPRQGLLSVVHAGWRGLARGVLEAAVRSFDPPRDVHATIGPAIGPCHYEVGGDVARAVASGSAGGAVTERRGGRLYLDLAATATRALRAAGVRRIHRAEDCTACEERRFFSHRRDGETGRQALIAMNL